MENTKPCRNLLVASLANAFIGTGDFFCIGCLNDLEPYIKNFTLSSFQCLYDVRLNKHSLVWFWALLSASVGLGGMLFSFAVNFPLEQFGMKPTVMIWKNLIQILASFMGYLSIRKDWLLGFFISRLLAGYCILLASLIPVFLTECAPDRFRGYVSMISCLGFQFFISLSMFLGLRQILGSENLWQFLMIVPAVFSLVHMSLYPFFPNSPKYLYITKGQEERAHRAVIFYYGQNVDINQVFEEYQREDQVASSLRTVSYWQIIRTRHLAWPFLLCIVASLATGASSIDIIGSYSTGLLEKLNFPDNFAPVYTLLFTQIPAILAAVCGIFLIERIGRRMLMLGGLLLAILTNIILFFAMLFQSKPAGTKLMLIAMIFSMVSYSIGLNQLAFILPGELAPQASRPHTSSFSLGFIKNLSTVLITLLFPPMFGAMGAFAVLPSLTMSVVILGFLFRYLPETKGRAVDEVVQRWRVERNEDECSRLTEYSSDGYDAIELIKHNR